APLGVVPTSLIAALSSSIAQFGAATKAMYLSAAASSLITLSAELTGADALDAATAAPSSPPHAAARSATAATQIHTIATWPRLQRNSSWPRDIHEIIACLVWGDG